MKFRRITEIGGGVFGFSRDTTSIEMDDPGTSFEVLFSRKGRSEDTFLRTDVRTTKVYFGDQGWLVAEN